MKHIPNLLDAMKHFYGITFNPLDELRMAELFDWFKKIGALKES